MRRRRQARDARGSRRAARAWEDGKAYDRLGLTTEYCEILNVRVPCVTIPVGPGRNLAVILELAAMNNRQKGMGYNAAQKLADEHDRGIDLGIGF